MTQLEFRQAIANANWRLDFYKFCEALGLRANWDDPHSREMWDAFQALARGVNKFDESSFEKLLIAGSPDPAAAQAPKPGAASPDPGQSEAGGR